MEEECERLQADIDEV
jgi:hypothetical protein